MTDKKFNNYGKEGVPETALSHGKAKYVATSTKEGIDGLVRRRAANKVILAGLVKLEAVNDEGVKDLASSDDEVSAAVRYKSRVQEYANPERTGRTTEEQLERDSAEVAQDLHFKTLNAEHTYDDVEPFVRDDIKADK